MKAKYNKNGTFVGHAFKKSITVKCSNCQRWVDENKVEFINVEEDFQGADILTFKCPKCNTEQRSRRYA